MNGVTARLVREASASLKQRNFVRHAAAVESLTVENGRLRAALERVAERADDALGEDSGDKHMALDEIRDVAKAAIV